MIEKAEFIRASGYTRRYHGWRILLEDPVGGHERNVAKLVQLLDPDCSKEVILYALGHDDAEWIVGDMPAPAKRRLPDYWPASGGQKKTFRTVFGEMEDKVLEEAGLPLPKLTLEEAWLVKFCDSFDGLLYCYQEIAMGNTFAIECWQAYNSYLCDLCTVPPTSRAAAAAQVLFDQTIVERGSYANCK